MNEGINDTQKIQKEILWGLYQEFRNHARHREILRSNVNNYMLIVSSALITVIIFDDKLNRLDLPLSLLICFSGFLCGVFSASYAEGYQKDRTRASELLKQLDAIFFEGQAPITLAQIKENADRSHYSQKLYVLAKKINAQFFWLVLPILVCIIGVVFTVLCWQGG